MFERFTGAARQTVVRAQEEARGLGHDYIGNEHLLIGIAAGEGPGSRALASLGVTPDVLRDGVVELVGRARPPAIDAEALAAIGIDLSEVQRRAEASFGPGALDRRHRRRGCAGAMPFTPRAKKSLELALREAVARGDNHIGSEHLLLGILRVGEGAAIDVLERAGAPAESVRRALSG
jgi:ATP-dependent Clp protease ATP-binding subunit ClpA